MNFSKIATAMLLCAALNIYNGHAQGLYVNLGLGYAFPSSKEVIGINHNSNFDENVYGSFGKGMNFGAGAGYMFSEHFGAELGLSYLLGFSYEITDDATTSTFKGRMLRLIPAVKVTGGESVKPYAKFGLVYGLATKVESDIEGMSAGGTVVSGSEEYSGNSSIGWTGVFGVDLMANQRLGVFVELAAISQSWRPDNYDFSVTSTNGNVSVTESGSRSLVDKLQDNSSGQFLKPTIQFSSLAVNAGIRLWFGGE